MHTIFFSATLKTLLSSPFDSQKLVSKNKASNRSRHDAKRARKRTGSAYAKRASLPPLMNTMIFLKWK